MPLIIFKKKRITEVVAELFGYDPYWENVVLLMHMDGANNGTSFIDEIEHTVSKIGDAKIVTSTGMFSSQSCYMDGGGDYLTVESSNDFVLGSGDFTIEGYFNRANQGTGRGVFRITDQYLKGMVDGIGLATTASTPGKVQLFYAGTYIDSVQSVINDNEWYHFAVCRASSVTRVYINGIEVIAVSDASNYTGRFVTIGGHFSAPYLWNGNLDEFRITKGVARYTSNFDVPTKAFPQNLELDFDWYWSNVILSVHGTKQDRSLIIDESSVHTRTVVSGEIVESTADIPFPDTVSLPFFSGQTISLNFDEATAIGLQDYTIEFFIKAGGQWNNSRFLRYANVQYLIGADNGTAAYVATPNGWFFPGNSLLSSTWKHCALVRQGTVLKMYVHGTLVGTFTDSGNYTQAAGPIIIGGFGGILSNIRIVRGSALYTGDFSPPTSKLTEVPGTVALISTTNKGTTYVNSSAFVDKSSNAITITPVGKPCQGSKSPIANGASVAFDGVSDYLTASHAQLALGEADFTVEFSAFIGVSSPSDLPLLETRNTGTGSTGFTITAFSSTVIRVWSGSSPILVANVAAYANKWVHIALVRASGVLKLYIDGVEKATTSTVYNFTDTNWVIGGGRYASNATVSKVLPGFISDFRVSNIARYASEFQIPQNTFVTDANTKFLLDCDQICFIDASKNHNIFNTNGNSITTNGQKFGNTGIRANNGQVLKTFIPGGLGSGDFTVEYWAKYDSFFNYITTFCNTRGPNGFNCGTQGAAQIVWYSSSAEKVRGSRVMEPNKWYHIAFVRHAGVIKGYINGIQDGTFNTDTTDFNDPHFYIGSLSAGSEFMVGYVDDLRITKGVARYTGNFAVKRAQFADVLPSVGTVDYDPYWNNVGLSLVGDSTTDTKSTVVATNVQISNAPAGGPTAKALLFSTGSMLAVTPSANFAFGTSDYTIELALYLTSLSGTAAIFDSRQTPADAGIALNIHNGKLGGWGNNANIGQGTGATTFTSGRWYHIAVCRESGITRFFVDGVLDQTVLTANYNMIASTSPRIGQHIDSVSQLNGYVANLRVTKGVARYPTDFTVPALPNPTFGASY